MKQKSMQANIADLQKEINITHIMLDAANKGIMRQEALLKQMTTTVSRNGADLTPPTTSQDNPARNEDINEGIPENFQFELETLRVMNSSSNNPGQFACFLVKVFPELFLSGWKSEYNCFGGGAKGKRDLESRSQGPVSLAWACRQPDQRVPETPAQEEKQQHPIQEEEHKEEMNQETDDQIPTIGPLRALLYTDLLFLWKLRPLRV